MEAVERPAVRHVLRGLWFAGLILLLSTIVEPFVGRFLPRQGWTAWILAAPRLWLVTSLFAFLAYQLVSILGWGSTAVMKLAGMQDAVFDPGRRDLFRHAAYLAAGLPFVAAAYGYASSRLRYQVRKVDVPIPNLPKALDGLKLVQLSDIHAGDFMPRDEIARAVEMANGLGADLAVVTGDFISSEHDPLETCIAELSKLRAPLGTWGCNGNHEIYAGAEAAAEQLFQRNGMRLLRQESVQLEHNGSRFNLIGVDYQRDRMTSSRPRTGPMLQEIEPLVSREMPNILLSHNPNSFRRAAELGIELSLAGHTHGGQVKVEIVDRDITPARLITDFVAGLYRLPLGNGHTPSSSHNGNSGQTAALYVNRGLGTFGMPLRLGVPPEITLLTLRAA